MDATYRTSDIISAEEQSAINMLRIFFFYIPLSIFALVISVVFISHQSVLIKIIATILVLPLVSLALGFLAMDLSNVLSAHGQYKLAQYGYKLAIPLMSIFRLGSIKNFHILPTSVLAELLLLNNNYKQAEKFYRKNASLVQQSKDALHERYIVNMLKDIGNCRYKAGDYESAYTHLCRAVILALHECYPESNVVGMPKENDQLNDEQCLQFAQLLLKNLEAKDPLFPSRGRIILFLGATLRARGAIAGGYTLIDHVVKLFEDRYPPNDSELFDPYLEYAFILRDKGDLSRAKESFAKAKEVATTSYNRYHPKLLLVQKFSPSFD